MRRRPLHLYGIAAVFAVIVVILMLVQHERAMILSDVRAYVAAEGLYAKAQKRAVIRLHRYVQSRSEAHYQAFVEELGVSIGDRDARLALLHSPPDLAAASAGFLRAGNNADEVDRMGRFFVNFQSVSYVAEAIRLWTEGDGEIAHLQRIGEQVRSAVLRGAEQAVLDQLLEEVVATDTRLTLLEDNFSRSLGDGARFMVTVTEILMLGLAALLLVSGWGFSVRVVRDVRSADATVRQSEARYRALSENIADGLLITQNGRFVHANPAALKLSGGVTMEELIGSEFLPLVDPEFRALVAEQHRQRMQGAVVQERYDIKILPREGGAFWAQIANTRIEWHGAPAVLTVVVNIQGRKDAEAEIRRLNESLESRVKARTAELKTALEEMESYSYSISHDLRAPPRAVIGFGEILRQEHAREISDEANGLLTRIVGNARAMAKLVDGLLDFARLGRLSVSSDQLVDMDTLARSVAAEVGAAQIVRFPSALPAARGDAVLLRQVWVNLLSNALKFSAGVPAPAIDVLGEKSGAELIYSVRDNGCGFDMTYVAKLFGVFQRLHRSDEFPGVGIGLALVKRIIERHGGRVWAQGQAQTGATFSFSLPDGA